MEENPTIEPPIAPAGPVPTVGVPGYGEVLRFAVPLTLGMLTFALLTIIDAAFVGRLGTAQLAALGLAGTYYFTGLVLFVGLMRNSIAFMARAYGEGNPQRIGVILAQYQWPALLALPVLAVATLGFPWVNALAGIDPEVTRYGQIYLNIRVWSSPFGLTLILYSSLYQSVGNSRFPMLVSWAVLVLNVMLDYVLIFGKAGFPALGMAGSALATVLAVAGGTAIMLGATFLGPLAARYRLRLLARPEWALMREVLTVGIPQGIGDFVEIAAFMGFFLIVGRLGTSPLAANNIGIQTTHLLYMPGVALGIASSSFMGRFIGAGVPQVAQHAVRRTLLIGIIYMGLLGVPLWFLGDVIASAFTEDAQVIVLAASIFKVMAVYQIFDGTSIIVRSALNGAGDTRFPTLILILCTLLVMYPAAWTLSLWIEPPVTGAWIGVLIYFVVTGLIMLARLESGAWRKVRVNVAA